MRIGIDFGTSYSAAGVVRDGQLELIQFGQDRQFRTAVFFPRKLPALDAFQMTTELKREADRMVRASLRDQAKAQTRAAADRAEAMAIKDKNRREAALSMARSATLRSAEEMQREAERALRRQWYSEQASKDAELDLRAALFGEEAIDAYVGERGGNLIVSPKSMLGYRLTPMGHATLLGIATNILRHIRERASDQLGVQVTEAVLGRPVEFRSAMGPAGGKQALAMLTDAAAAAGFEEVSFLEEPCAAAWTFHTAAAHRHLALIVDVGGGTTDVAFAEVGGDAAVRILRSWGLPLGGTDVDLHLSLRAVMPLFGKDRTPTPVHNFSYAAAVQDIIRQRDFKTTSFENVDAPFNARLRTLQQRGNTVRLNRHVEEAKIALSERASTVVALDFIEADLAATVERSILSDAAWNLVQPLRELLTNATSELEVQPSRIYLTGGMSRAPYILEAVASALPGLPIELGDASLAVVAGLAHASASLAKAGAPHETAALKHFTSDAEAVGSI